MKWLPPLTALTALLLCVWLRASASGPVLSDVAAAAPGIKVDLRYATCFDDTDWESYGLLE